jgi:FkbM family methyltransferase
MMQVIRMFLTPLYRKFLKGTILGMNVAQYFNAIFPPNHPNISGLKRNVTFFYNKNMHRVNAIVDTLADRKSKKIYLGMIRYRQTRSVTDYPFHYVKEPQYFINELELCPNEIFIDCGAFIGDTIDQYSKYQKQYKRIIAFEPDLKNFEKLKEKYEGNSSITLINTGLWDKDGEVSFSSEGACTSKITNDGGNSIIQVRTIDGLELENVTFIKMDIEGAELNALKGAQKTILKNKPKLAISIYHNNGEDMVSIPEYIYNLVPQYRLYVRQYGYINDTVLYAIMP